MKRVLLSLAFFLSFSALSAQSHEVIYSGELFIDYEEEYGESGKEVDGDGVKISCYDVYEYDAASDSSTYVFSISQERTVCNYFEDLLKSCRDEYFLARVNNSEIYLDSYLSIEEISEDFKKKDRAVLIEKLESKNHKKAKIAYFEPSNISIEEVSAPCGSLRFIYAKGEAKKYQQFLDDHTDDFIAFFNSVLMACDCGKKRMKLALNTNVLRRYIKLKPREKMNFSEEDFAEIIWVSEIESEMVSSKKSLRKSKSASAKGPKSKVSIVTAKAVSYDQEETAFAHIDVAQVVPECSLSMGNNQQVEENKSFYE